MRNLLLFFLTFSICSAYAQPGVTEVEVIEGKKFYIHEVKSGNTLWGLSNMYDVEVTQIVESNPELVNGLKEGQKIYIPVTNASIEQEEVELFEHKVKRGETLYGISRKYNTTVDNLIAWNPGVENGLQIGQNIKVPGKQEDDEEIVAEVTDTLTTPNPFVTENIELEDGSSVQVTFSDSTIRHVVLSHETMYSISNRFMVSINDILELNGLTSTNLTEGQVLLIPVKKEEFGDVQVRPVPQNVHDTNRVINFQSKDSYNIVLLLPFYISGGPSTEYVSGLSTDLYLGALMALDTLESMGLNAKLYVYDTKNDSSTVANLLATSSLTDADLIIGPLFGKTMGQVARFCKNNQIRMVCPISSDNKLLMDNPFVYSSVSSDLSLFSGMGNYLAKHPDFNRVVLIEPTDEAGKMNLEYVRSGFQEAKNGTEGPVLVNAGLDNFSSYVKKGEKVVFVYPTENKAKATSFMSKVNTKAFKAKDGEVSVVGAKEWVEIDDLNNFYKNKYGFHYAGPNFLDYYSEEMKNMNFAFRKRFNTDMTKVAIQGYDVMLYFCSSFFLNVSNLNLLMNDFRPKQLSPGSGYDNAASFIIEQEDYELVKRGEIIR